MPLTHYQYALIYNNKQKVLSKQQSFEFDNHELREALTVKTGPAYLLINNGSGILMQMTR